MSWNKGLSIWRRQDKHCINALRRILYEITIRADCILSDDFYEKDDRYKSIWNAALRCHELALSIALEMSAKTDFSYDKERVDLFLAINEKFVTIQSKIEDILYKDNASISKSGC